MEKVNLELEINSELFAWFEDYCEGGLLDLDEELAAVITQYIEEQLKESGEELQPKLLLEDDELDEEDEEDELHLVEE